MDYYERMPFKQVLLPLIFICTLGAQAQTSHAPDPDTKISALDAPLFYQLLVGELSARSEEPGTAFSLILDAARKTNDPLVFRRSVQIALQARSGESALAAAQAWSLAIPSSKEANRFVLQILLGLNRIADTIKPLQRELTLTPAKEQRDLIWSIPGIYERVKDKQIAASIVQKALTGQTANAQLGATAWSSIGRMWLSAGDKTAALSAATKGLALDPQSEHPALLALSMMSPDGPQAERLVKVHLPTARPEFLMAYVKTLLSAQREGDATAQLKIIQSRFPSYADAWLIDGALALQTGQSSLAEKHLQRYLELDDATPAKDQQQEAKRGRAQAFFSMAQIAQQRKDLPQAIAWLQRVDNPDDMVRAQVRKAMLIAQLGRVDEAIDLIHAQSARSEADAQLKRSAEIQVLREKKLFERARDTLTVFTTQNPDDLDLVYDLAMVYEKLGNLVEMESLLSGF
jgi:tetratricopeptide (TPR) repeat protein